MSKDNGGETINNYGGQVNISKDKSTLYANMNIGSDSESFPKLVNEFLAKLKNVENVSAEDKQVVTDLLNQVSKEAQQGKPTKTFVQLALKKLEELTPLFVASSGIGQLASAIIDALNRWV